MRMRVEHGLVAVAALAVFVATASAGPIFDEPPGGTGNSTSTATSVVTADGTGDIGLIKGELKGSGGFVGGYGDYQDVYRIYIADPSVFSAQTFALDPQSGLRDPMLYLFDEQGRGIAAMNNLNGDDLQARLHNGDGAGNPLFTEPGIFYLAITSAMSEPTALFGGEIVPLFEMGLPEHQTGQVLPHGGWGGEPFTGWTAPTDPENIGLYEIGLSGVVSLPIPAPAGLAVFGLAALGRRRRR